MTTSARSNFRWITGALALLGFSGLAVGAFVAPRQALFSYLVAWAFCMTTAIGVLAFSIGAYITHAKWIVAIRRLLDAPTLTIPLFAILFAPIALGAKQLYVWAAPEADWSPRVAEHLKDTHRYLNLSFWSARAIGYLALWSVIALLLRSWSLQTDAGSTLRFKSRSRVLSSVAAPLLGLSFTFAAFDWFMSLDPAWTSNAYGLYLTSAALTAGIALLAVALHPVRRAGVIPADVGAAHSHAVGNLTLAMVMLWAYIAFVQMMLIWMANLPEEVTWYIVRTRGAWALMCWFLGLAHFAIPFLVLLQRRAKRDARVLGAVGAWLLVSHFADMYWLIMPTLHPRTMQPHWLDLAALLALGGSGAWFAAWRFKASSSAPHNDPELPESLRFEMT